MLARFLLLSLCALSTCLATSSSLAEDTWYRFPASLEGTWKVSDAQTAGYENKDYIDQPVVIVGSTIHLRTKKAGNLYTLTYVGRVKDCMAIDITRQLPDGTQRTSFKCLIEISKDQIRLVRPQNGQSPRPTSFDDPTHSDTIFALVRDNETQPTSSPAEPTQ